MLNCWASIRGVEGGKYEIPLRVVRHFPSISSGGLLRITYTSVTVIWPYLKDPCGFGRAAPAETFHLKNAPPWPKIRNSQPCIHEYIKRTTMMQIWLQGEQTRYKRTKECPSSISDVVLFASLQMKMLILRSWKDKFIPYHKINQIFGRGMNPSFKPLTFVHWKCYWLILV